MSIMCFKYKLHSNLYTKLINRQMTLFFLLNPYLKLALRILKQCLINAILNACEKLASHPLHSVQSRCNQINVPLHAFKIVH